jgi:SAM-dependent methyltransferase
MQRISETEAPMDGGRLSDRIWAAYSGNMPRSQEVEILDGPEVSDEVLADSYHQLKSVHRFLGNNAAVIRLLRPYAVRPDGVRRRVLDIGCGQGALLMDIRKQLGMDVVGFDLRVAPADVDIRIVSGNAVTDRLPECDVAVSVVMAHHLSEEELVGMIRNVARSSQRFILLDLVRHPVPLMLFRTFVCPWLGRVNALDGQTSIRRSFTSGEMRAIVDLALAGIERPVVKLSHTIAPFWIRQIVDISWGV